MKTKTKEKDHAEEQAKAQLENIIEMVDALEKATGPDNRGDAEDLREKIQEDPLSVRVRSSWVDAGGKMEAEEFEILLCTGGPAVRIMGDLDEYKQPSRAWIQYQDWGTPWTDYNMSMISDVNGKLLTYCQQFYFGE